MGRFQVSFDETGEIRSIDTLLYGQDEKEKKIRISLSTIPKKVILWSSLDRRQCRRRMRKYALVSNERDLEKADWKNQVKEWAEYSGQSQTYEILYMGRRAFQTEEGLQYIEGSSKGQEGYGVLRGNEYFKQLRNGGEIIGFEVSLHIPEVESVTPVRYMMEPGYLHRKEIKQKNIQQQVESAKDTKLWTIDQSDGTMYFFLNEPKDGAWWLLMLLQEADTT